MLTGTEVLPDVESFFRFSPGKFVNLRLFCLYYLCFMRGFSLVSFAFLSSTLCIIIFTYFIRVSLFLFLYGLSFKESCLKFLLVRTKININKAEIFSATNITNCHTYVSVYFLQFLLKGFNVHVMSSNQILKELSAQMEPSEFI